MENPFNISIEKLKVLIDGYETWLKSNAKEAIYPQVERDKSKKIKENFLDIDLLSNMSEVDLYNKIFSYSRSLEGPVQINLGEKRIKDDLPEIRRNLMYIMQSDESPYMVASKILEGDYKIDVFAKAFWSPILQAQFPNVLPNWNNKTEQFLKKLGVKISTSKLSIAEKYRILSEAFTVLSGLSNGHDFYTINHLMHYGTAIPEGSKKIDELLGNQISDPVKVIIKKYKEIIKETQLKGELYKWKLLRKYRGRPDVNVQDFSDEVQNTDFSNLIYRMAKPVKNLIAKTYPEDFRKCLIKLFDEDENLTLRVNNFMIDIDNIYKKSEGSHFHHHDERTISTYLTYHNPDKYTFYKDSYYQEYCKLIGTEAKSKGEKYTHYLELVSDFIENYIIPDAELISQIQGCMDNDCFSDEHHLLLAQDILFQMLENKKDKTKEDEEEGNDEFIPEAVPTKINIPLNSILFGPPGTGKTYGTINEALKIFGETTSGIKREVIKQKFAGFQKSNRVFFTTFHQNMAYEDFIEGIKPVEPLEDDEFLRYEIQDGLFMRACVEATFNFIRSNFGQDKAVEELLDFNGLFDKLIDRISKTGSEKINTKTGSKIIATITSQGNISIKHEGRDKPYTVSRERLSKLYEKFPSPDEISNINDSFRKTIGGSNSTAYWSVLNEIVKLGKTAGKKEVIVPASVDIAYEDKRKVVKNYWEKKDYTVVPVDQSSPYVFIIDEINRGNVAQIFGELITLIEDDKRMGKQETLFAELPYSKHSFAIPPNLYIIGTMNTADRSVEALDSALRRRFSFIEMVPQPEKLDVTSDGIDLPKILRNLNNRLLILKDHDHTIGHAWLMGISNLEQLKNVFGNKILPLLKEYFYNDYEKLGLVLGDAFFMPHEQVNSDVFANFSGGNGLAGQYEQSWKYRLKSKEDLTIPDFQSLAGK